MADVLGVDEDTGARVCHGKWQFETEEIPDILVEGCSVPSRSNRYLTDRNAKVLAAHGENPDLVINPFGKGCGVYLGGFCESPENTRMLLNILLYAGKEKPDGLYLTDNPFTECAYYPESGRLVVINNSGETQHTSVKTEVGIRKFVIDPYDQIAVEL